MDGWHSVLGTWNATTDNAEIAGEATKVNPGNNLATAIAPPSPLRDAHPHLPSIFCHYPQRSGHRGLHSCAPGIFTCEAPNCTWPRTFKTKQALNGHYHAKHHNDRVDCPIEGCARVGAQGIKRADNLAAHMLNKHGISHPRMSFGN